MQAFTRFCESKAKGKSLRRKPPMHPTGQTSVSAASAFLVEKRDSWSKLLRRRPEKDFSRHVSL
jgi:hypothetical protein